MSLSSEEKRNLDTLGVTHISIENGGFYQGITPGGFPDVQTHIKVPGPKVEFVDAFSREIKAFKEIPEPVQFPHFKIVLEKNERSGLLEEIERDFNAMDIDPIHLGLLFALQTGVIRYVPEYEMQEKYPDTWAKRSLKLVWRNASDKPEKTNRQLLDEAEQSDSYLRNSKEVSTHVKAVQTALAEGKVPPKPLAFK